MGNSALFTGVTGLRLWQALEALAGFGLTDLTGNDGSRVALTRLHPLVQDARRPQAGGEGDERAEYLALGAALLRQAAADAEKAGEPEDPTTGQYGRP